MKIDLSYIKPILFLWYFSYIVACTAVAQSLVPKNFTIIHHYVNIYFICYLSIVIFHNILLFWLHFFIK